MGRFHTAVLIAGSTLLPFAMQGSTYTFSLTQDGCTGGCGTGPYGTVTITDEGSGSSAYVLVTETLLNGNEYVNTGAGDALEFQLSTTAATSITQLTTGFTATTGSQGASTFGSFNNGVDCTGCGSGASKPLPGPISFDVTVSGGLTTTDFVTNADGNYFASDILGGGNTGNVAADTRTVAPTPEPGSLSLIFLGSMLLLAGVWRRRAQHPSY